MMLRSCLARVPWTSARASTPIRPFSLSALSLGSKPLPARLKIEDADLTVSYLKGSGPGGQKIVATPSLPSQPFQRQS